MIAEPVFASGAARVEHSGAGLGRLAEALAAGVVDLVSTVRERIPRARRRPVLTHDELRFKRENERIAMQLSADRYGAALLIGSLSARP